MKWQSILFVLGALSTSQVIAANGDTINCDGNPDSQSVRIDYLQDGIDYINGLSGAPTAKAGKCNRVSCSYGAGIYVCSDDGEDHPLKSWKTVGSVTTYIMNRCQEADTAGVVRGRLHSPDGWGVLVQEADC
ncbi:hypothetical protein PENSTE_c004G06836 [Penicillium steckii]|uniref:Cyanovirin-N domain-containing protein n=1 Tax=Penicillium steckii TaxID=303698 RepID=A0A1V6TM53_9EURO|nr:hypothetical protein PENSTE_c004G06836 [Penicillium steckii]